MKNVLEKLETEMVAATFAEAGEFDTARRIMSEDRPRKTDRPRKHASQRPSRRREMRAD